MAGRLDPHAVLWGWSEIADALGCSVRVAQRLARRGNMPLRRDGAVPEGMVHEKRHGVRVYIGGEALHRWLNGTKRARARVTKDE